MMAKFGFKFGFRFHFEFRFGFGFRFQFEFGFQFGFRFGFGFRFQFEFGFRFRFGFQFEFRFGFYQEKKRNVEKKSHQEPICALTYTMIDGGRQVTRGGSTPRWLQLLGRPWDAHQRHHLWRWIHRWTRGRRRHSWLLLECLQKPVQFFIQIVTLKNETHPRKSSH